MSGKLDSTLEALVALSTEIMGSPEWLRGKAEARAEDLRALAVEPDAEQLAQSAKFYGIDTAGLTVSDLARAVTQSRITRLADKMKLKADNALFVCANRGTQDEVDARGFLAHDARLRQALPAGDFEMALRHLAVMHDVHERLFELDPLLHLQEILRDTKRVEGNRANAKLPRRADEYAHIVELFKQKLAAQPTMSESAIKHLIERELNVSRDTINRALRKASPTQ